MTTEVLIRQHGNRRLYHSAEGRYVSLEQLRAIATDEDILIVVQDDDGRNITDEVIKKSGH